MAKFCTKCGKKLEDGEVCTCQQEVKQEVKNVETERVVASAPTSSIANDYLNKAMDIVKGIFTHPIQTMKQYGKAENMGLGLILIAINCLVYVLFIFMAVKEVTSNSGFMYFMGMGSLGSTDIPMEVLVKIFVLFFGGFAGTALTLYVLAGPVFKGNGDIKQAFALVGTASALTTVTTLVALVCMYISTKVMGIVLGVATILYWVQLYHGFIKTTDLDEEKTGYSYTAAIAVAAFLVFYLIPKILF